MTNLTCPKCHREMQEGFILELGDDNVRSDSRWVEGKPERGFWPSVKIRGKKQRNIQTFRCVGCGFLESYANQLHEG